MSDQASEAVVGEASDADILSAIHKRSNPEPQAEGTDQTEQPETIQADAEETDLAAAGENAEVEGQDANQPDLSAVKVPVTYKGEDGQEVTEDLPLDEIRSGYMRQRDYTLKTQEVSKARAAIPQAVEQGVTEARNQYTQSLAQLHALVQQTAAPELAQVDWQKLATESPAEFVRLSAKAQQVQNTLQAIAQRHHEETQRATQAKQQALQQEIAASAETLKHAIPGFSHEKYEALINGAAKEYGQYGVTREDIAGITDAKAIIVINDALAYRALKAKQPSVANKIAQAPIPLKPGTAKSRSDVDKARTEPLQQRLRKTGDLEDAVALYAARTRR